MSVAITSIIDKRPRDQVQCKNKKKNSDLKEFTI